MNPGSTRKWWLSLPLLIVVAVAAYFLLPMTTERQASGPEAADGVAAFLDRHWSTPLPAQAAVPQGWPADEAALGAEACGQCHTQQYEDWQTARHSHTMRAGILWQFHVFDQVDSNRCMDCHAPLAEQKALAARDNAWPAAPVSDPPPHVPTDLHLQGLTCSACHVRGQRRFGPPSRKGLRGNEPDLPHGGFEPSAAFEDSRFCSGCHQFPEDGPRLNGKLRQDTYNEWLNSDYGRRNVTCQSCHMPDRRHLWRGISDPEMTRRALSLDIDVAWREDGHLDVVAGIVNSGAGHHFPAYLVPRVEAHLVLIDPAGRERVVLGRHVFQWRTGVDLEDEAYDQRLPAGESVQIAVSLSAPDQPGWAIGLRFEVAPKEHYERVYRDMLRQADQMRPDTLTLLRQALAEAEATRYGGLWLSQPLPVRQAPAGAGGSIAN
ncbi:MAG: multiheme c-type cytochrome [Ectothiorhodospiraceae bacterium]|jgi:hypothetical protein|nr:multiheme c-type cytochrome [Ectothiorhodospiraceae bacterium]